MKSLFKNIAAALALTIILFGGCKNPAEDVQIVVNTDIFKSPTLIQFVNAKKGATAPKDFTVTFTGPGASLIRTTTGGKTFKATEGMLNIVLDRSANPSPASPVNFTVIATAPGFAPVTQDVSITSTEGAFFVKIPLNEYAAPATGSAGLTDNTKPLSSGATTSSLTYTTPINTGLAQQTSITVPAGTSFKDASGQALSGGTLDTRVVFTGMASNGTSPTLPGGNVSKNVVGPNGPMANGAKFYPAGVVSIDMYAGGKEVRTFSQPVTIDMEVSPTMTNPNTNQPIKAGETMPMWSVNDDSGQINYEGTATLMLNGNGKLVARMSITHLSHWFTGYIFDFTNATPDCTTTIVINKPASNKPEQFSIISNASIVPTSYYGQAVYFSPGETTKTVTLTVNKFIASSITVIQGGYFMPYIGEYTNLAYENSSLTSNVMSSLCGQTTTFTFVARPAAEVIDVDVDVKVKCGGKDLLTGINAGVTISPLSGLENTTTYYLNQGKGSGQIVNGTTYKIVASVDGKAYTSQFTATKDNFKMPDGFDLVGTAVFENGRLKINGTVTKTDCN